MKLYIFRHGETKWNTEWRLQGRTDTDLNENGIRMAEDTSKALESERFDYIFSSPLKRAHVTASILKGRRNTKVVVDDRLKEVSFGVYEGTVPDERPKSFQLFFDAPEQYEPPEGAEAYESLVGRAGEFLKEKVFPIAANEPDAQVVICGHGALNRALMAVLLGREIKDIWAGPWGKNCSASIFDINTDGEVTCLEEAKIFYNE